MREEVSNNQKVAANTLNVCEDTAGMKIDERVTARDSLQFNATLYSNIGQV